MKRKILKDFVLTEISGVDRPAQPTAKMSIMKRADDHRDVVEVIEKAGYSFAGYLKAEEFDTESWRLIDALRSSIRDSIASGDSVAMRSNIEQFANEMSMKFPASFGKIAKCLSEAEKGGLNKSKNDMREGATQNDGEDDMSEVEKLTAQVAELQKSLDEAQSLAKMSDDEKMHMEKMSDKEKALFMAMSPGDRKKKMGMAKRDDETVEVAGQTIAKSVVGDQMFAILKAQDAQLKANEAAIAKAQLDAEMATLTKRAGDEFSHVPGTADEVAALLKAAQSMPEGAKATLDTLMKSYEQTIAKAFESQGHAHVDSPIAKSATEQVETLVKKYMDDHKADYATAYTRVIEQNPKLYDQMNGEGN